ncbi:hypothetical protein GOBAR_AA28018 [Gossypium barbadense]|uniref:RING-type E3 ubiquitin transferase n=1 Tax=Gossypium barbadense TaxID=3634 RepID=A0A2P5WNJ9_GOSBA|nr:hypothetical protein GOBAR_AA28018 [Gossypium barbadense]
MAKRNGEKRNESVAVAIDKDKGSQHALKWAVDHLISRGQSITLLHVKTKPSSIPTPSGSHVKMSDVNDEVAKAYKQQLESQAKEVFLPFRCFCSRKDIKCNEVILEGTDISKALIDYVSSFPVETLVLGAPSRSGFVRRFRTAEVTTNVSKGAPDYCTIYVIGKGKISSVRSASAPPPPRPQSQPLLQPQTDNNIPDPTESPSSARAVVNPRHRAPQRPHNPHRNLHEEAEIKSPFTRARNVMKYEPPTPESDISFVSSGKPSSDTMFSSTSDNMEFGNPPRLSSCSDFDNRSMASSSYSGNMSVDFSSQYNFSFCSEESGRTSWSSHNMDDVEAEMRRLKQELKQTMDMYSAACKEALSAKKKAMELQSWKMQEEQKKEEARVAEKAALSLAETEKAKSTDNFSPSRKIGGGGYGPVYHSNLDHTPVAIKVLRPDATQGQSQFQQEVEVLSCIRHPNMVLLLGACPEYGCLVYEYMANGSLEDRLFMHNNSPVLPWQIRFRIAAEIATGLLFLHHTKPKPLVHRDLKPANILLDHNYVSKISDVGLARLVPPSVANSVTQYRMTSAAGTFCYIDPEYQQTGMLGIKSDVYSLGIMLLQIITAKPPMGLAHRVENAIEEGSFAEILDPAVTDWPLEEALSFAKLALKCAELRRRDRPDLGQVVLPHLNKLRDLAESNMPFMTFGGSAGPSPNNTQVSTSSMLQDFLNQPPQFLHSECDSTSSGSD